MLNPLLKKSSVPKKISMMPESMANVLLYTLKKSPRSPAMTPKSVKASASPRENAIVIRTARLRSLNTTEKNVGRITKPQLEVNVKIPARNATRKVTLLASVW